MQFLAMLCCVLVITDIKEVLTTAPSELFTIYTEGCAIAGFPKVSERVKKIVGTPPEIPRCSSANQLVVTNSSHMWVMHDKLDTFNVFREDSFHCCYRNFSAVIQLSNIVYGECNEFSTVKKVEHEFVRVDCYYFDEVFYSDFFLFTSHEAIAPKAYHNEESFNILILGFESMSRLNFHRTMSLTSNFLKNRGMVDLLGYNKVGDNSFPNLFPLLTGLSFDYVKKTFIHKSALDKCTFIWDKFQERGYHTALGADSTAGLLGNYEYYLPKIPTQFYLQPFMSETSKLFKNQNYNYHKCMGSKLYYKILLDYIYGLTHQLKFNRLFGMFWEESISHEDLNTPHVMDESYLNLLTNLDRDNYLDETIVILLSDHGTRWGEIVQTEQGRLEDRLPLLGILFPEKFRRRYKLAFQNFQRNANRLTSPYDIYETLLDLLNPSSLEDNLVRERSERSDSNTPVLSQSSLFVPMSELRNCKLIGIEEHWCACHRGEKIKVESNIKTMAAHNLVVQINRLIKDYPQCHKLVLDYIYDVYLIDNNKQWQTYTVMLKTSPSNGIFDGTLIHDGSRWVVSGTVSRLNLYRNQSDCVTEDAIKMYCYCG